MASFFKLKDEEIYIPTLEMDGRNWSTWCESVESVIKTAGLQSYLDGTVSEPNRQLEAAAKFILVSGIPDSMFGSLLHLETAHYYKHLTNQFDKSTVQPLQERLRKREGCRDAEPQVAVRTRKAFDGACRKCGERGHKACECGSRWKLRRSTENHSRVEEVGREGEKASARAGGHKATATTAGVSSQEDDGNDPEVHHTSVVPQHPQPASRMVTNTTPDAANLNATSAEPTRPEGMSYNPPDQLPSTPLEG